MTDQQEETIVKETVVVQGIISYLQKNNAPTIKALQRVLSFFGYTLTKTKP